MSVPPVRVTHRDIAKKFGCSTATVSLALSDHPRIREEVRRRIHELAEQMGYRPDPALTMLARNRFAAGSTHYRATLSYLVNSREPDPERRELQSRYFISARQRAEERGYQIRRFDLAAYESGAQASRVLYHRGVQGLIIPEMAREAEPLLRDFEWDRFAVVCCMLGWLNTPFHVVRKDIFNDTRLLWREAVARGYRRIGGALFQHDPIAEDDYSRYGAAATEQRLLIPASRRLPLLLCSPQDEAAFLAWMRRFQPDAILAFCEAPYRWLLKAGYKVPGDVAFAMSFVDLASNQRCSGVSALSCELGQAAVDHLIAQIHHNLRGIPAIQQSISLEPKWVEGETMPRVNRTGTPPAIVIG